MVPILESSVRTTLIKSITIIRPIHLVPTAQVDSGRGRSVSGYGFCGNDERHLAEPADRRPTNVALLSHADQVTDFRFQCSAFCSLPEVSPHLSCHLCTVTTIPFSCSVYLSNCLSAAVVVRQTAAPCKVGLLQRKSSIRFYANHLEIAKGTLVQQKLS